MPMWKQHENISKWGFPEPISKAMCLNLTMSRFQPTLLIGAETSPHGVNATGPTCINLIFLRLCPERRWWNSREATTLFTEQVFEFVLFRISQKPIENMAMPPTRSGAYSLHKNSSEPTTSQVIAFIPSVECHRFVFLNAFKQIFFIHLVGNFPAKAKSLWLK